MAELEKDIPVHPQVRIGMVNFINTAPVYDVWLRTVKRPDWSVVEAPPAALNRMLYAEQLDMGLVSSQEYGKHPENYILLDDISISSSGAVGSVFLFSRCEPDDLGGKLVRLTSQSQTSVSLVKIILENFFGVLPRYETGQVLAAQHEQNIAGVLAIGDEALILAQNKVYPHKIDLGRIWHEKTALPFVFAVWAIRAEFSRMYPESVREIQRELLRCRDEGRNNLKDISKRVSPRVSMSPDSCYEYLRCIQHDLGPDKKRGLVKFIEYLIERGEGRSSALPLRLFS